MEVEMSEVPGPICPVANLSPTPEPINQCCICTKKDGLHLCVVNGGGNSLVSLLCAEQDESSDGNKEPTRLITCWECDAIMSKVLRFQQQACKAQKRLSSMVISQIPIVLRPSVPGARDAMLPEYHLRYSTSLLRQLRTMRYKLPDGSPTTATTLIPRIDSSSHQSSLRELLVGIHQ